MDAHLQEPRNHDLRQLRREAGQWIRELRGACRLTQRELAQQVGVDHYTFIAQLEAGRGRIPPDRYEQWAQALKVRPADFVRQLMSFYDPETYRLLFGGVGAGSN